MQSQPWAPSGISTLATFLLSSTGSSGINLAYLPSAGVTWAPCRGRSPTTKKRFEGTGYISPRRGHRKIRGVTTTRTKTTHSLRGRGLCPFPQLIVRSIMEDDSNSSFGLADDDELAGFDMAAAIATISVSAV